MALWLDADQPGVAYENNDPVTEWKDRSGNNNDFTSSGSPTFKTNQVNGLPAIEFNGSDDFMDASSKVIPIGAKTVWVGKKLRPRSRVLNA